MNVQKETSVPSVSFSTHGRDGRRMSTDNSLENIRRVFAGLSSTAPSSCSQLELIFVGDRTFDVVVERTYLGSNPTVYDLHSDQRVPPVLCLE